MQEQQEKRLMIWTLIFVAIAAIFFAWAAFNFVQELVFLHNADKVIGTVTDISVSTSFQDQQTWTDFCPVIKFQTQTGRNQ